MTLRERGFTECSHPAMAVRRRKTKANCEVCGALKTKIGWVGGSLDYDFDLAAVTQRHGARIRQENTH